MADGIFKDKFRAFEVHCSTSGEKMAEWNAISQKPDEDFHHLMVREG